MLVTKFLPAPGSSCVAMSVLFLMMKAIRRHYEPRRRRAGRRATSRTRDAARRNHAIVLVSKMHKPTLRALAYARATRPST